MASVFHLVCDAHNIKQKIVEKYADSSESDKKLFFSAVTIQRTWKGYSARKMLKDWNQKSILIQKFVRGWLSRLRLPKILKNRYYDLSVAYYNKQATKIQALWRGYYERKHTVSLQPLLAERQEIERVNREMQEQMRKAFADLHAEEWNETRKCLEKVLMILFDRHHLLRTVTKEGIFSMHGSDKLSCIEKILKSFPLTDYMKKLRASSQKEVSTAETTNRKKFDLNTNMKPKPYERMLFLQE